MMLSKAFFTIAILAVVASAFSHYVDVERRYEYQSRVTAVLVVSVALCVLSFIWSVP